MSLFYVKQEHRTWYCSTCQRSNYHGMPCPICKKHESASQPNNNGQQSQTMLDQDFIAYAYWGSLNPAMICPHCQLKGMIRTKKINRKKGVSGGKAVSAILTGGISLLAVGLSRKEKCTQAHCDNCQNTWDF